MTRWMPWDELNEMQRGLVRMQWSGAVETLWWRFIDGASEWNYPDFFPFPTHATWLYEDEAEVGSVFPDSELPFDQVDGTPTPSTTQAQTSDARSLARTTTRFSGDVVRDCRAH